MSEIRLPLHMHLPNDVLCLFALFKEAGHQLFVVGGAVRDAVMGLTPKDFDLATDATPDCVLQILCNAVGTSWATDEVGKSFGVIRARRVGKYAGDTYEIATFRQDIGTGRRPDSVVFSTIEEDVKRRDLTMNALFYDISTGEVVDLVGGLQDIKDRVVRTVGDPKARFAEDRLRVLRALRFEARFDFALDESTRDAVFADNDLDGVSPERIRDEFLKCVRSSKDIDQLLYSLSYYQMWERIFPGLDVFCGTFQMRDPIVLLAFLLRNNDVKFVARRLAELTYTNDEVRRVCFLLRLENLNVTNAYELRKAATSCGVTDVQMLKFAFRTVMDLDLLDAFFEYSPSVKGDDVMATGLSGPTVGREIQRREMEIFERMVAR